MDSDIERSLERAQNEIIVARVLKQLTEDNALKRETFKIDEKLTFYSSVIGHAYYTIFYAARAYVVSRGVKLPEQGIHQAVYFAFRKFVREGKLNEELLALYDDVKIKAEILLEILKAKKQTAPSSHTRCSRKQTRNLRMILLQTHRYF